MEVGNMLLDAASDDLVEPDHTRRLLKELREVRMAKFRAGTDVLDAAAVGGGGVALTGVGAMEIGEGRGFVTGVVDGLRYVKSTCRASGSISVIDRRVQGKSAHPKNKHGENKWPKKWPMAVMMPLKTMTTKWNSDLMPIMSETMNHIPITNHVISHTEELQGLTLAFTNFVQHNKKHPASIREQERHVKATAAS